MNLSVRFLKLDFYTHGPEEVPPGTHFGFWCIMETTGAGWFPWPARYTTKAVAEQALKTILARYADDKIWL